MGNPKTAPSVEGSNHVFPPFSPCLGSYIGTSARLTPAITCYWPELVELAQGYSRAKRVRLETEEGSRHGKLGMLRGGGGSEGQLQDGADLALGEPQPSFTLPIARLQFAPVR